MPKKKMKKGEQQSPDEQFDALIVEDSDVVSSQYSGEIEEGEAPTFAKKSLEVEEITEEAPKKKTSAKKGTKKKKPAAKKKSSKTSKPAKKKRAASTKSKKVAKPKKKPTVAEEPAVEEKEVDIPAPSARAIPTSKALQREEPHLDTAQKQDIARDLEEIYENRDGSMPDMTYFPKRRRGQLIRAFFTLFVACGVLGAVIWFAFTSVQPSGQFSKERVILTISGEEAASFGDEVQYRIRYRNDQRTPLEKAVIRVRYPEGFVYTESSREPSSEEVNNEWTLDTVDAHDSGYIDVYGRMYGDVGAEQSFRVFLNYYPMTFSSEFQEVSSANVRMNPGAAVLSLEAPEEVRVGVPTDLQFLVEAADVQEDTASSTYALRLVPGASFSMTESDTEVDALTEHDWSFSFDDEEQFPLKVTGVFSDGIDEEPVTMLLLGTGIGEEGDEYIIASSTYSPNKVQTEVGATLAINGATDSLSVSPGDILNTSLLVKNNGEAPIEDVQVRLIFDAPSANKKSILYWGELDDEHDGDILGEQLSESMRRGEIFWTKRQIAELASLDPGESVSIDIRMPVKSSEEIDLTEFTTASASVTAEVSYTNGEVNETFASSPLELLFTSDAQVEVRDEIETVDEKDQHTITWLLTNSFHELKDITLKADLYGDITWDEEALTVPAGEAVYNEEEKQLVWTIESMPTGVDVLALRFVLTLNEKNPTQENLASRVTLTATDAVTGEQILRVGDEVLLQ